MFCRRGELEFNDRDAHQTVGLSRIELVVGIAVGTGRFGFGVRPFH